MLNNLIEKKNYTETTDQRLCGTDLNSNNINMCSKCLDHRYDF